MSDPVTAPRSSRNRTRYVILGMLSTQPMNGYALRRAIEKTVGHFWQESYGQLYPALHALAGEGLVREVKLAGRDKPRARQGSVFEVTSRGRETLASWLALPPVLEPGRNELLLKVFFGGIVPPAVTLKNLAAVGEVLREKLARLDDVAEKWDEMTAGNPDAPLWRLTLDFGRLFMNTALKWLDEAERVVGAREGARVGRPTRRGDKR
jgi:PadR family transcriptional regulator, regulatory protein AphA